MNFKILVSMIYVHKVTYFGKSEERNKTHFYESYCLLRTGYSGVFVAVRQPLYVIVTVSTSVGPKLKTSKAFLFV
jgi:hypothetical protein